MCEVTFQVLTAANMKMVVFVDKLPGDCMLQQPNRQPSSKRTSPLSPNKDTYRTSGWFVASFNDTELTTQMA
jgi:hypothetical protein